MLGSVALSAPAQDERLLGTARTVLLQSDVIFHKDRKFNSNAVPYVYILRSGLAKFFRPVTTNPDIILRIRKDVFVLEDEKISITVFNPDDNSIIYSEERRLVDDENDVSRLITHFIDRVRLERETAAAEAAAEVERQKEIAADERDAQALKEASVIVSIFSTSEPLLQRVIEDNRSRPNQLHIFLRAVPREKEADVLLTESAKNGNYTLTLVARDTKEVLHSVTVPMASARRAVISMGRWITSTSWE